MYGGCNAAERSVGFLKAYCICGTFLISLKIVLRPKGALRIYALARADR